MGIFIIFIIFMLIGMWVSFQLKSRFKKYSKVPLASGLSGKEVAEKMLYENGIHDVQVISVPGHLSDHYNPAKKTINLSPDVFNGRNVAAAAVAAHETGHAIQHARAYGWLKLRSAMVPAVSFSSKVMYGIFLIGLFFGFAFNIFPQMILVIIICQGAVALFSLVTLPVEFDASNRALAWLKSTNVTAGDQHEKAKDALKWAAMTYVVAATSALATLFYYVMIYLGSRD